MTVGLGSKDYCAWLQVQDRSGVVSHWQSLRRDPQLLRDICTSGDTVSLKWVVCARQEQIEAVWAKENQPQVILWDLTHFVTPVGPRASHAGCPNFTMILLIFWHDFMPSLWFSCQSSSSPLTVLCYSSSTSSSWPILPWQPLHGSQSCECYSYPTLSCTLTLLLPFNCALSPSPPCLFLTPMQMHFRPLPAATPDFHLCLCYCSSTPQSFPSLISVTS